MRQVKCSCVVQTRLIPKHSLYRKISAAQLYSQDSSYSNHYTASSVQISCTAISHPTAFTIPHDLCSSFEQESLIPQHSLYCQFSAALLYSQVLPHSSRSTASSVQLCCTDKSYPIAVTILAVQCSSVVQPSLIPQQSLY